MSTLSYYPDAQTGAGSAGSPYTVTMGLSDHSVRPSMNLVCAKLAAGKETDFSAGGGRDATGWVDANTPNTYASVYAQAAPGTYGYNGWRLIERTTGGGLPGGTFAAGDWQFSIDLGAIYQKSQAGKVKIRVFHGQGGNYATYTEVTSGGQAWTSANGVLLLNSQTYNVAYALPSFSVAGGDEIVVTLSWEITAPGTSNSADVQFATAGVGPTIVTTDFTASVAYDGSSTEAAGASDAAEAAVLGFLREDQVAESASADARQDVLAQSMLGVQSTVAMTVGNEGAFRLTKTTSPGAGVVTALGGLYRPSGSGYVSYAIYDFSTGALLGQTESVYVSPTVQGTVGEAPLTRPVTISAGGTYVIGVHLQAQVTLNGTLSGTDTYGILSNYFASADSPFPATLPSPPSWDMGGWSYGLYQGQGLDFFVERAFPSLAVDASTSGAGGPVYNESVSESALASDSQNGTAIHAPATYSDTVNEAAAASDSQEATRLGGTVYNESVTEVCGASDSPEAGRSWVETFAVAAMLAAAACGMDAGVVGAAHAYNDSLTEAAVASDASDAQRAPVAYSDTVTEGSLASEASDAARAPRAYSDQISEAASAWESSDGQRAPIAYSDTYGEVALAASDQDGAVAGRTINDSVTEAALASDAPWGSVAYSDTVTEAALAAESSDAAREPRVYGDVLTESALASEASDGARAPIVYSDTIAEGAVASADQDGAVAARTYSEVIGEGASAADAADGARAPRLYEDTVTETATAADASEAARAPRTYDNGTTDAAAASDAAEATAIIGPRLYEDTVTEAALASDAADLGIGYAQTVEEAASASEAPDGERFGAAQAFDGQQDEATGASEAHDSELTRSVIAFPASVGVNAWTNPTYAYANDTSYATCAPGKGATVTGEWGTFGISIPSGATITSVTLACGAMMGASASNQVTFGFQAYVGGVAQGSEYTTTALTTGIVEYSTAVTGLHAADLANGTFTVQARATRAGNTSYTVSLDYISVTVVYDVPVEPYLTEAAGASDSADAEAITGAITGELDEEATASVAADATHLHAPVLYGDNTSEVASASDALDGAVVQGARLYGDTIAEAATASDEPQSGVQYGQGATEAAAANDALDGAVAQGPRLFGDLVSETAAAADASESGAQAGRSQSDAATASDAANGAVAQGPRLYGDTIAEVATASADPDALRAAVVYGDSLTEAAAAGLAQDGAVGARTFNESITSAALAGEAEGATLIMAPRLYSDTVAEPAAAADASEVGVQYGQGATESAASYVSVDGESISGSHAYNESLAESALAAVDPEAGIGYRQTVTESATAAADAAGAVGARTFNESVSEAARASDATEATYLHAPVAYSAGTAEVAAAAAESDEGVAASQTLTEAAGASDSADATHAHAATAYASQVVEAALASADQASGLVRPAVVSVGQGEGALADAAAGSGIGYGQGVAEAASGDVAFVGGGEFPAETDDAAAAADAVSAFVDQFVKSDWLGETALAGDQADAGVGHGESLLEYTGAGVYLFPPTPRGMARLRLGAGQAPLLVLGEARSLCLVLGTAQRGAGLNLGVAEG